MSDEDRDSPDLEALYREERPGLVRLAFLLLGSLELAEDAFHDAVASVAPRLGSVEQPGAYLRRAVINAANTMHRKADRPEQLPEPVHEALDAEAFELWETIGQLDQRRRTAVVLRYYLDLPVTEIAKHLDCSPDAASSLIYRAVADLRKELGND